jgi:hypothetical protein
MVERRRCEVAGCKGYAVQGASSCRKHQKVSKETEGATGEKENSLLAQYAKFLTAEELALAMASPDYPGLSAEIDLARVEVLRALQEGDSKAVGQSLVIVMRLMEAQRRLTGDQAAGIVEAVTQIINELTPNGSKDEG